MGEWNHTNICEVLVYETRPLACDVAHFHSAIGRLDLKHDVHTAHAPGTFDAKQNVAFSVVHAICWWAASEFLFNAADLKAHEHIVCGCALQVQVKFILTNIIWLYRCSGWRLDGDRLLTAGIRSKSLHYLASRVVEHLHLERVRGATTVASAEVGHCKRKHIRRVRLGWILKYFSDFESFHSRVRNSSVVTVSITTKLSVVKLSK